VLRVVRADARESDTKASVHLWGRQFRHVRNVCKCVLGCGVFAVGVGAGFSVVDLRVVLTRNIFLIVFYLARLGTVLRFAARGFSLGRHRRSRASRATGTRRVRVWNRRRAIFPPPSTCSSSYASGKQCKDQVNSCQKFSTALYVAGCRDDIYRCNGAEGAVPPRAVDSKSTTKMRPPGAQKS